MNLPDSKLAVTLFNLRDYCKTESELDETLDKVCKIGYQAVQVSAVPLPADVIRKQLDKHNLYCCATHENIQTVTGDPKPLMERLQTLGCNFTALGMPPKEYFDDKNLFDRMVAKFNENGKILKDNGMMLAYHNHAKEFTKFWGSDKTYFETFYAATDPKTVYSELDVHWVTRGGGSPEAWIRKLAGRISVIHFKDMAFYNDEPAICEIGQGNLNWPGIIKACEETGVRWYSIEQDCTFMNRNIFDSIKMSFDYLTSLGVK